MLGSYFSPLLYSNSSPQPDRDVVGDADRCTQERKERLQRRQRRTEANLEMTRAKAELDELLQQVGVWGYGGWYLSDLIIISRHQIFILRFTPIRLDK